MRGEGGARGGVGGVPREPKGGGQGRGEQRPGKRGTREPAPKRPRIRAIKLYTIKDLTH
jgi:hypothetical protein